MSERTSDDRADWADRHARTRADEGRTRVVAEELEDDWHRRHAECRRST